MKPAALLRRFANLRREEVAPTVVAALFFFFVLTALMVVRPAREALGMQRGIEAIRWLFVGTAVVTLLVNPLFGLLVSRFRRLAFINATYLFFALGLVAFHALLVLAPARVDAVNAAVQLSNKAQQRQASSASARLSGIAANKQAERALFSAQEAVRPPALASSHTNTDARALEDVYEETDTAALAQLEAVRNQSGESQ